jgi:hypothetical protein
MKKSISGVTGAISDIKQTAVSSSLPSVALSTGVSGGILNLRGLVAQDGMDVFAVDTPAGSGIAVGPGQNVTPLSAPTFAGLTLPTGAAAGAVLTSDYAGKTSWNTDMRLYTQYQRRRLMSDAMAATALNTNIWTQVTDNITTGASPSTTTQVMAEGVVIYSSAAPRESTPGQAAVLSRQNDLTTAMTTTSKWRCIWIAMPQVMPSLRWNCTMRQHTMSARTTVQA